MASQTRLWMRDLVNAPRVEGTIAGSYKSASGTIVAQIQLRKRPEVQLI